MQKFQKSFLDIGGNSIVIYVKFFFKKNFLLLIFQQ